MFRGVRHRRRACRQLAFEEEQGGNGNRRMWIDYTLSREVRQHTSQLAKQTKCRKESDYARSKTGSCFFDSNTGMLMSLLVQETFAEYCVVRVAIEKKNSIC
jgi:hypothetical protein